MSEREKAFWKQVVKLIQQFASALYDWKVKE
jgi:hypothetical protein